MTADDYKALDMPLATLALWYVVNTSLSAYYKLTEHFDGAYQALNASSQAWQALGIHVAHVRRHQDSSDVLAFVERILAQCAQGAYGILHLNDDTYPDTLAQIYDPPPVLFYRGQIGRLADSQIAIVGSRKPTEQAAKTTYDLAQYLAYAGYTVTSGLAGGVDKAAHLGALDCTESGRTVGVMGTGIDVCYPKNHNALYAKIIDEGGCLISELLPATPATKHNFPRRNRLVAGLSMATVVTEATIQSGSLITARLAAEQGKQVFAIPSHIDNINAEGCHHLIREGATLIYHPRQILEELSPQGTNFPNALPKTFSRGVSAYHERTTTEDTTVVSSTQADTHATPTDQTVIPHHLDVIYQALTGTPCDLDRLVMLTQLGTGELLAGLLELELLGVAQSTAGRYVRL